MTKMLNCKCCEEPVEVPDRQLSVVCQECAEKALARKELAEEEKDYPSLFPGMLYAAFDTDPCIRKGYLHYRALQKARHA